MAHHNFNDQLPHGRMLRQYLNAVENVLDIGADVQAVMAQMLTGDGSQEAHFAVITTRFGFADNANAKSAWDEVGSALSKTTGDGSVSSVNAALKQVIAKLR